MAEHLEILAMIRYFQEQSPANAMLVQALRERLPYNMYGHPSNQRGSSMSPNHGSVAYATFSWSSCGNSPWDSLQADRGLRLQQDLHLHHGHCLCRRRHPRR